MKNKNPTDKVWIATIAALVFTMILVGGSFWIHTSGRGLELVWGAVGAGAGIAGFAFSIWITRLSLRSEHILKESLDLTRKSTTSQTHLFDKFSEHIGWLEENLDADKFKGDNLHLRFGLSTFAYGIGVLLPETAGKRDELKNSSAHRFLKFMEKWAGLLEKRTPDSDPCLVDIALWGEAEREQVFDTALAAEAAQAAEFEKIKNETLDAFKKVVGRFVEMHVTGKIRLNVCYSSKSDSRLFLARDDSKFRGLMVVFTPLSQSAIVNLGWRVCGLSVNDEKGYWQLSQFFQHLSRRDHDPKKIQENLVETHSDRDALINAIISAGSTTSAATASTPVKK